VTPRSCRSAGGTLSFGVGSDMLAARRSRAKTTEEEDVQAELQTEVGVIPLGLPTLAGPGAITTVITLTAQAASPVKRASVFLAIVAVLMVSWAVLAVAPATL